MAIVKFANYQIYKETLDRKMTEAAGNFVTIGYMLKLARDTDILSDSGYSTIADFAKAEYGLDSTATSRFISICERYGNGEDRLLPQYEAYGYSKLSEMLTLPDAVAAELPPEITREEIREIKQEIKEEEAISDIEVAIEAAGLPEGQESVLLRFFREYFREFKETFRQLWEVQRNEPFFATEARAVLMPNDSGVYMARVPGIGKLMLKLDKESAPKLVNIRENDTQEIKWAKFFEELHEALGNDRHDSAEAAYQEIYGEALPELKKEDPKPAEKKPEKKVKIAPAQKKKEKKEDGGDDRRVPEREVQRSAQEISESQNTGSENPESSGAEAEETQTQAHTLQEEPEEKNEALEKAIRFAKVILEKLEQNGKYELTNAEFDMDAIRLIIEQLEAFKEAEEK